MYGVPTLAILLVVPSSQLTSLHGFIDALRTVLTVWGGDVHADGTVALSGAGRALGGACALLFVWVLLASGSSWIMGAGRTMAAACLDGAGPRALGRISPRTGVPVAIALLSGALALATAIAEVSLAGGDAQAAFSAALTTAIALIVLAYLLVFPSFAVLRARRPELDRPFRVPGGQVAAWAVSAVCTTWAAFAAACLLWPGIGTARPDDALPAGFAHRRAAFEAFVLVPVGAVLTLGVAWHRVGRRTAGIAPAHAGCGP
jgi:amino acid transporter